MNDSSYEALTPEQKAEVDGFTPGLRPTGYDEFLYERVKQLKDIDENLERIERYLGAGDARNATIFVRSLRMEMVLYIAEAEQKHADF